MPNNKKLYIFTLHYQCTFLHCIISIQFYIAFGTPLTNYEYHLEYLNENFTKYQYHYNIFIDNVVKKNVYLNYQLLFSLYFLQLLSYFCLPCWRLKWRHFGTFSHGEQFWTSHSKTLLNQSLWASIWVHVNHKSGDLVFKKLGLLQRMMNWDFHMLEFEFSSDILCAQTWISLTKTSFSRFKSWVQQICSNHYRLIWVFDLRMNSWMTSDSFVGV